jgi:hypothetical protein
MDRALAPVPPSMDRLGRSPEDFSYLLGDPRPLAVGPANDPDYTEAKEPQADDVLAIAEDLKAEHSVRVAQSREFSHWLDTTDPGFFEEFAEDIKDGIVETMPLLGQREAYEFRCGFLANHEAVTRLLNRDSRDRDEAMVVEDYVNYLFQSMERQYARETGADLRWARIAHAQRFGMLAGLTLLDPEDPYCGMQMQLLDPLTVFPVWGGRGGITEVYQVYEDTNENIIGSYGGKPGSQEYERIRRQVEKHATKTKVSGRRSRLARNERRCVTACWNRDWLKVVLDDEDELLAWKHGYHRVPVTVRIGAFDAPAGISLGSPDEPYELDTDYGTVTVSDASIDLARQLRPFNWRQMGPHRLAEAIAGVQATIIKWSLDPMWVREFDPSTEWKLGQQPRLRPGETVDVPLPAKLTMVQPVLDPTAMAGTAANLQANVGGGFLNQLRLGAIPPQTSGSAMGKMAAMGGASETVLVRMVEGFLRDQAEFMLYLTLHFGDAIGKPLGSFSFPARSPGAKTPMHEITPEILGRTGIDVDVELFSWEPDVTLAQYLTTLRAPSPITGKPLISDDTARRKLKATPDVERETDRIDDEALTALAPVQQQRHKARMERDIERALDEGDDETAEDLMIATAELEFIHEQAVMAGQAAPPGAAGGGNGASASTPSPDVPPPALPGTSLPDMGIGVGQEGGAPMQMPSMATGSAPPPAMRPVGPPRRP